MKPRQVLQHEDWFVLDLVQTGYHESGRVYLRVDDIRSIQSPNLFTSQKSVAGAKGLVVTRDGSRLLVGETPDELWSMLGGSVRHLEKAEGREVQP